MQMTYGSLNLHNTELILTAGMRGQLIKTGLPQVAFAGRSNVGKSSLINSLLGRKKLARVSSEPGKTITVNHYSVDGKLLLVDLPGYGFAKRPKSDIAKWSSLTEDYFTANSSLKYILQLIDIRIGLTPDDRMMIDYIKHYGIPFIIVATKCDKLSKNKINAAAAELLGDAQIGSGTDIILYSSVTGEGRDNLWRKIYDSAFGE